MLLLPRIEDPGSARGERSPRSATPRQHTAPLKSVFHLSSKDGCEISKASLRAMQQRKLSRASEDAPALAKGLQSPRKDASVRPLSPMSSTRSTHRFNGVEGISLSQAGSWLDSRCFREACELGGCDSRPNGRPIRPTARRPGAYSEGERFVLKRCKDMLLRRYGNLHTAFKRWDVNGNNNVALVELMDSSAGLIRPVDAKILHRLLDLDGNDFVSLSELQSLLEAV
mmetsp:Transcript_110568/g.323513  ORF Transcript_110568/g.323513 Transcript_110568/m.323513 type:complete len:227 (-) Transcript_110568:327-1007(-)